MSGVLVDTSVWVDHFRRRNAVLVTLLETDRVLTHPLVVLEVACGTPPAPRARTFRDLRALRQASVATTHELLALIEERGLHDSSCGAVDVALVASALLTPDARLWTADRDLGVLARRLGIGFDPRER